MLITAAAAESAGLADSARIAAASDGISTFAVSRKNGVVTSFSATGKVCRSIFPIACASW